MANPFRKIPAHSPVTAFSITAYNRMIDMLNWWQTNQGRSGGGPLQNLVDWNQGVFRVRNDTGGDLASYDPVGLGGPIFTGATGESELQNQTSQIGVAPTVADHAGGKWGVMLEAAPSGRIGRCCMAGVVPVRVYVTAVADKYVDVNDGGETVGDETVYLSTGGSGAQILWLDPDTAAEAIGWAIVRMPGGVTITPPVGITLFWLSQSASAYTGTISNSDGASASIRYTTSTYIAGDLAESKITKYDATTYDDPCFSVDEDGLYVFLLQMGGAPGVIANPNLSGTVSGGTCSVPVAFPVVQPTFNLYTQLAAGGAWTNRGGFQQSVFAFSAGWNGAYIKAITLAAGDKIKILASASYAGGALTTDTVTITGASYLIVQKAG